MFADTKAREKKKLGETRGTSAHILDRYRIHLQGPKRKRKEAKNPVNQMHTFGTNDLLILWVTLYNTH